MPAGPVGSTSYDDWLWNSTGITGDWCGVRSRLDDDALGVMVGTTIFSDDVEIFRSTGIDGTPGPSGGRESIAEIFYRIQLTPAMMIQF
ncbi:MAG: hypothetical protein CMJ33_03605 [Phycisphaerae bacterium]|nr:hypothetical protein [Phycisphaerae bacterium]